MTCYICARCDYKTIRKSNVVKHFDKKKRCEITKSEAFEMTEEAQREKSLTPIETEDEPLLVENADKKIIQLETNQYQCVYCNKCFTRRYNANRHIIFCKFNVDRFNEDFQNNVNIQNKVNSDNVLQSNNIFINNLQINIQKKNKLTPFDEKWDLSHFSLKDKKDFITRNNVFTLLLEEVLKNDDNLNVILRNDDSSGVVFKNDSEKYVRLNKEEIIEMSMEKLNIHLTDFVNETKEIFNEGILKFADDFIKEKYKNFKTDENVKMLVESMIGGIFDSSKKKAIEKYEVMTRKWNEEKTITNY